MIRLAIDMEQIPETSKTYDMWIWVAASIHLNGARHKAGKKIFGAPQLYLFESNQTEQMEWKPNVFPLALRDHHVLPDFIGGSK